MKKPKLTPEERSQRAKAAAAKRYANKAEGGVDAAPADSSVSEQTEQKDNHCPACMAGQSLEEGEGTHILATIEHPVVIPDAFQDAESSVVSPTPKPVKARSRPMPKELRTASSYAEKRLPKAVQEKADLIVELQRREAEIQELTRVIQALKGQAPVGIPNGSYQANSAAYVPTYPQQAPPQPQLPPMYAEYSQPQPVMPVITPPRAMKAGGAGVAAGMMEVPNHWYEQ